MNLGMECQYEFQNECIRLADLDVDELSKGWGGLLGRDVDDFITKSIQLYRDETLWNDKSQRGVELLQELFNKQVNGDRLLCDLERCIANKMNPQQRYNAPHNYVQHILSMNQYKTQHYMTKYIALKNKTKRGE